MSTSAEQELVPGSKVEEKYLELFNRVKLPLPEQLIGKQASLPL